MSSEQSEQQQQQSPNTNMPTQLQTITVPEGQRYIARVKWFDNTLSYGFATVISGDYAGRDIFVHQSNILTLAQGIYRTLRMGEYIEFNVEESAENNHRYQAIAVTGPCAGQLMCESNPRRPRVSQSRNDDANQQVSEQSTPPKMVAQNNGNTRQQHNSHQSRPNRVYQSRGYNQTPIQVVVEYPGPHRQQYRHRQTRPNTKHQTASAAAAANIAATLSGAK